MTVATVTALLDGAATTAAVSAVAIAAGVPLGLAVAIVRLARIPVVSHLAALYVSAVRAIPVVTFVMFVYFGIPALGVSLEPLPAALLALSLNTAAFHAEVWRAAIADFPRDQLEAARAFGMRRALLFRRVVFPQVWRASLPGLANEMTLLVKASPAVAVIGVVDLTRRARQVAASTYEPLPPFLGAAVLYGVVLLAIVLAARALERSLVRRYGTL